MKITQIVSLVAMLGFSSLSVAACAANTDASADPESSADQDLSAAKIHACNVDADCVAVPAGGCCNHGYLEAVNKHHTKAYANSVKCTQNPRPFCPMFMVKDTRVAECNSDTKQCEMVGIDDIACDGHSSNPHACPTDYTCNVTGSDPDATGKCEAPPPDCQTTGCGTGKYCTFCWGKYACIPNGALC